MVDMADQIYRAKLDGKSFDEIRKLDDEERAMHEEETADERTRLLPEHQIDSLRGKEKEEKFHDKHAPKLSLLMCCIHEYGEVNTKSKEI
ncbi:unnamed protein product, partial [Mesorhabditis belari]|uniref:Uncharacterized protein n=1 Tax=Mesorhabditis belari TaxID=2138241 RepID=A0AAF3FCD4_9BILA